MCSLLVLVTRMLTEGLQAGCHVRRSMQVIIEPFVYVTNLTYYKKKPINHDISLRRSLNHRVKKRPQTVAIK